MTYYLEKNCPICGKHRGRGFDHTACSKILQKRRQAEMQERDERGRTLEQRLRSSRNQTQKRYQEGAKEQWWPD